MATAIGGVGGTAVIHRYNSVEAQAEMVSKVEQPCVVGAVASEPTILRELAHLFQPALNFFVLMLLMATTS